MFLSALVYLFVYLFICLFVCSFICLSVCPSVRPSVHPSIRPSIHLSIYLFIYLDYAKINRDIFTIFGGNVAHEAKKERLDYCDNLAHFTSGLRLG